MAQSLDLERARLPTERCKGLEMANYAHVVDVEAIIHGVNDDAFARDAAAVAGALALTTEESALEVSTALRYVAKGYAPPALPPPRGPTRTGVLDGEGLRRLAFELVGEGGGGFIGAWRWGPCSREATSVRGALCASCCSAWRDSPLWAPRAKTVHLDGRTFIIPQGPAASPGQGYHAFSLPLHFLGFSALPLFLCYLIVFLILSSLAISMAMANILALQLEYGDGVFLACPPHSVPVLGLPPPHYPLFPSCFLGATPLSAQSALAFAAALNATPVFSSSLAPLAADVCGPVLGALAAVQSNVSAQGVLARLVTVDLTSLNSRPWDWMWFGAACLHLVLLYFACSCYECCRTPRSHADPREGSKGLDSLLFSLLTTEPTVHMLSYTRRPTAASAEAAATPQMLAQLLLDCYIDVKDVTNGLALGDQTLTAAVFTRCLVLFITPYYLTSAGCMKELFAALRYRRVRDGRVTVALLAKDLGEKLEAESQTKPGVAVDWAALEAVLERAFAPASGEKVVFHSMGAFLEWVERPSRSAAALKGSQAWFQRHALPRPLKLSAEAGALLSSYPTRSMRDDTASAGLEPAPHYGSVDAPRAGRVVFTSRGLLRNPIPVRIPCLYLLFALVVLLACFCLADLYYLYIASRGPYGVLVPLEDNSNALSKPYGFYGILLGLSSGLSLCGCIFFLCFAIPKDINFPSVEYSNYLQPLLTAAHFNETLAEAAQVAADLVLPVALPHLKPAAAAALTPAMSPIVIYFIYQQSKCSSLVNTFLDNLRGFIERHIGLQVVALAAVPQPTQRGVYCLFLDSGERDVALEWRRSVELVPEDSRVLAVSDAAFHAKHSSLVEEFFLAKLPSPPPPPNEGAAPPKARGVDAVSASAKEILMAIAGKVGAALLY